MPYKSEKIKLSREQDRRIKLNDAQREEIAQKVCDILNAELEEKSSKS